MKTALTCIAGAIALASISQAASAQKLNTALTSKEIDAIMDGPCAGSRAHASRVVDAVKWNKMLSQARSVLAANMDIVAVRRMIDNAESLGAGGDRVEREQAEFQICLLGQKIYYAERR